MDIFDFRDRLIRDYSDYVTSRPRRGLSYHLEVGLVYEDKIVPRLAPTPLHLNETEREQLQQLVNRHNTPQQIAIRASIILKRG